MAQKRPLVLVGGNLQELPLSDTIAGGVSYTSTIIFGNDSILTPTTIAVDQDDYNPTNFHNRSLIRLSSSSNIEITGFAAPSPAVVTVKYCVNVGGNNIKLKKNNASSLAANRILLKADVTFEMDESWIMVYDVTSSRWRLFSIYET